MRRLVLRLTVLLALLASAVLLPAQAALAFTDVPSSYWDYTAITYVATTHTWMQDYGTALFQPLTRENRTYLARSLVTMYAPNEPIDPNITFPDLPVTDPFYPYANVAVKLGWILPYWDGRWAGGSSVPVSLFDQALINAMGLSVPVAGLNNIRDGSGKLYPLASRAAQMQLARWLGLHYDHTDDSLDIQQSTYIRRDEVAYSLWMAQTLPQWSIDATSIFDSITLPILTTGQQGFTSYELNQIGYPYIWAGEWNAVSPPGYCCGSQPQGGFDCSGFVWWVLKKYEDGYNAAQFRAYGGWSLHERSSQLMAQMTTTHLTYAQLGPGILMFFASDGGTNWTDVDHVGIYMGNGWMMHSTGGGPQLQYVGSGYYHDTFVYGRQLKASSGPPPKVPTGVRLPGAPAANSLFAGDPPIGPDSNAP